MSGRCRDCKHWQPIENQSLPWGPEGNIEGEPYFDEDQNRHYVGFGDCERAAVYDYVPVMVGSKMVAHGEYRAGLYTAPDFGCVEFETATERRS